MSAPSTIDAIKARLRDAGAVEPQTPFAIVRGATALAQVKDRPPQVPAAYVLAPHESAGDNERMTGPVLQRVERDIMVVIVVEHLGDHDGDEVIDPLEALKRFVRGKLVGWAAPDMDEPVVYAGGEIAEAVSGCVWFEMTFSAPVYFGEQ